MPGAASDAEPTALFKQHTPFGKSNMAANVESVIVAVDVIRSGQEVASHHVVAVINHIGMHMFTALAQAAMDEQWIEVANLGSGKKAKLFLKAGHNWMSFGNLCLNVVLV